MFSLLKPNMLNVFGVFSVPVLCTGIFLIFLAGMKLKKWRKHAQPRNIPCFPPFGVLFGTGISISTCTFSQFISLRIFFYIGAGTGTWASPWKLVVLISPAYLQLQELGQGINRPAEAGPHRCRGPVLAYGRPDFGTVGRLSVGPGDLDGPLGDAATEKLFVILSVPLCICDVGLFISISTKCILAPILFS